jgi:hypothetical protein
MLGTCHLDYDQFELEVSQKGGLYLNDEDKFGIEETFKMFTP